ncbi:transposase [Parabacteroides johnsonii]|uniref:transposase n=1 Tax=Parabacteroides johnsonii TaxID=387661 RepID=UPI00242EDCC8|nr:transposase [Parabacteroides johnsonii]
MKKYDRHSIRLKGYDYSCKGLYFVTVCVQDRKQLLGNIMEGIMEINDIGELVQQEWLSIEQRFPVVLHEYTIMPNHFHAIIELVGAGLCSARIGDIREIDKRAEQSPAPTVGDVVCAFKSLSTKHYNRHWHYPKGHRLWQRNYYEHIIRNYDDYDRISCYIHHNPGRWEEDVFYG